MPTVAIIGPYRFFFYASDGTEPPHVHVERESASAKFWLLPVELERHKGFSAVELRKIQRIVDENRDDFHAKWNQFFAHGK
jgi:hypothetical protein